MENKDETSGASQVPPTKGIMEQMHDTIGKKVFDIEEVKGKLEVKEATTHFKPDITDIKVGYELEYHNSCIDKAGDPELNYSRWEACVLTEGLVENFMKYGVRGGVRVPYLTKEQLLAESGFIVYNTNHPFSKDQVVLKKDNYYYVFETNKTPFKLSVIPEDPLKEKDDSHYPRYNASCKCINTFRTIVKLLEDESKPATEITK